MDVNKHCLFTAFVLQHEYGNGAVVEKVAVSCCVAFLAEVNGEEKSRGAWQVWWERKQKIIQGQKLLETKSSHYYCCRGLCR
jgi:hypothetical protein